MIARNDQHKTPKVEDEIRLTDENTTPLRDFAKRVRPNGDSPHHPSHGSTVHPHHINEPEDPYVIWLRSNREAHTNTEKSVVNKLQAIFLETVVDAKYVFVKQETQTSPYYRVTVPASFKREEFGRADFTAEDRKSFLRQNLDNKLASYIFVPAHMIHDKLKISPSLNDNSAGQGLGRG